MFWCLFGEVGFEQGVCGELVGEVFHVSELTWELGCGYSAFEDGVGGVMVGIDDFLRKDI